MYADFVTLTSKFLGFRNKNCPSRQSAIISCSRFSHRLCEAVLLLYVEMVFFTFHNSACFFALFLKAHVHFLSLSLSLSLTLIYLFLSFTCLWESFIYWRASSALSTIRYFEFMQILPKIIEIFRR